MAMPLHPPNHRPSSAPPPHPPVVATRNDGDLPLDLLYDILLRLPAETLCRFRAVCRSWQSLLSHPDFIAGARNPGPLIAVGIKDYYSGNEVTVLDMVSGNAVTRVNVAANDHVYGEAAHSMRHDRVVCVVGPRNRLRLLDLANGVVSLMPDHAPPLGYTFTWWTVGRVTCTGEHKVLAIATSARYHKPEICEILTLGLSGGGWKDTGSPPLKVFCNDRSIAAIKGFAYFLSHYTKTKELYAQMIMVFDFNNEAWRPAAASLRGPANCPSISLAELDNHLVAGHVTYAASIQLWTLWFLVDSDRSLWSKRYTITIPWHPNRPTSKPYYEYQFEKPLAMLGDGRIVLLMRVLREGRSTHDAALRIYNPKTKTFKDGMVVPSCNRVSVFMWSLLHSGKGGMLDSAAKRLLMARRHH